MKKLWITSWLAASCGLLMPLNLAQSDAPPTPPPGYQQDAERRSQLDAPPLPPAYQHDVEKRLEMRRSASDREGQREEAGRMREGARPRDGQRGPFAGPTGEAGRESAPATQGEIRELRRNRAQLMEKLEQLRNQGAEEDAANVKQRIADIDRRMAQLAEARGPRPQPSPPRQVQEGQPGRGPGNPEAERRLRHLTVAIENLHAAGMHDPAERLAREREEMMQQMRKDGGNGPDGPQMGNEIRRLRAELDEVRQALRALKGRVEELHSGGH